MQQHWDWIVVGAGIVGQSVAWNAAKQGHSVALLERESQALGASIRNFGMIWPIGQPSGSARDLALESRQLWLEFAQHAGFPLLECGSLHLAHHDDELEVLEQWLAREQATAGQSPGRLCLPEEVQRLSPAVNPAGLRGGLYSPWECRVDPRQALQHGLELLERWPGVQVFRQTTAVQVEAGQVVTATGQSWTARHLVICTGADFAYLLPDLYRRFQVRRCKLHMLRVAPPQANFALGPHLASGLTLRHYAAFEGLPALADVRTRYAAACPELDHFGIHVMLSQSADGELILGDSHQYDDPIDPLNDARIDDLILQESRKVFALESVRVTRRWTGVYAKHQKPWLAVAFAPHSYVLNGLGGAGMTLSLAVGRRFVARVLAGTPAPLNRELDL